jgi:histidinol phosphatase-like PHP family hydrolase
MEIQRMGIREAQTSAAPPFADPSNAQIADRLVSVAQLLSTHKENPHKVKACCRVAAKIRSLSESLDELLPERSAYEADVDRIVAHARASGCFFEIDSSADRLDLSADNARVVSEAQQLPALGVSSAIVRQ